MIRPWDTPILAATCSNQAASSFVRRIVIVCPIPQKCITSPRVAQPAPSSGLRLTLVLLVADLLHPLDVLAVQPLQDRDVRHRRGRRGAVPVLLARRAPDHVTGADLLDRPSPALDEAKTGGDDQRLPERMRVPRRPRSRFERHA